MRLVVLFSLPYPPGGDAGEQLYSTHVLLGTVFPSPPNTPWQIPPLYYFLFFVPFTYTMPFFTGATLLIGITPALLVFPAYWLLKKGGAATGFALFGAALLASSTMVSSVASYNAGYNLAGLFFALFFFAELVAYLRSPNRRSLLLASIMFVAVGATHFLTFLFVVAALLIAGIFAIGLVPSHRRTLRSFGVLLLGCAVGSLALIPTYYNLVPTIVNVGPSSATLPSNLPETLLPMAWGYSSWSQSLLGQADVIVTLVSLVVVIAFLRKEPIASVLLGMVGGSLAVIIAYPGSFGRGVVFLPFALCPAIALAADALYLRLPTFLAAWRRRFSRTSPLLPVPSIRRRRSFRGRPSGPSVVRVAKPAVVLALAACFLLFNASFSYSTMSSSSDYYQQLSTATVQLLDWLAHNTSLDAKILLATPAFYSWVLGYANRMAYAPIQLNNVITSNSYASAYSAWLLVMGQYVSGNGLLATADSLPASDGGPNIYLQTPYGWTTLENASSDQLVFQVQKGASVLVLPADGAVLASVNLSAPCPECSGQALALTWPSDGVEIIQSLEVNGTTSEFRWTSETGTLRSVSVDLAIPPSGAGGLQHGTVPRESNVSALEDAFYLYGTPFSLNVSGQGGEFSQATVSTGWTYISYQGSPLLSWSVTGLGPVPGKGPFSINSTSILRQLGLTYIVANPSDMSPGFGHSLYSRCITPNGIAGVSARQVYADGGQYVFSLE